MRRSFKRLEANAISAERMAVDMEDRKAREGTARSNGRERRNWDPSMSRSEPGVQARTGVRRKEPCQGSGTVSKSMAPVKGCFWAGRRG